MTLQEIFKDDLNLLKNESVKKLIDYVQNQQSISASIHEKNKKNEDDILEVFMYSEVFLINGLDAKESLKKIGKILNR